jgi:hypothetical protein
MKFFLILSLMSLNSYAQLVDFSNKAGEVINAIDLKNSFDYAVEGRTRTKGSIGNMVFCSWQAKTGTTNIEDIYGDCVENITGTGTGYHTINFKNNFWAGKPHCSCSVEAGTPGGRWCNKVESIEDVYVATANSTAYSYTYDIVCHGPAN